MDAGEWQNSVGPVAKVHEEYLQKLKSGEQLLSITTEFITINTHQSFFVTFYSYRLDSEVYL
ncbi:hypothetical protein UB33_01920 [Photobacterium angustum]|uniref:Uncharacterized protein n=1 Tax=Photobacterium angustum TaxID=661 RepID=A0A2S7VXV6_PHOAN|nr:hypothetical protein UB39_06930 [Photobacterium angustum]KJG07694.1 hypothetical protein UB33_01920 [Photobacterium angustum]PQJ66949.1 hypothetical protein BTO08_05665 [Photobacterium angustum]